MRLNDVPVQYSHLAADEELGKQNKAPALSVRHDTAHDTITVTAACVNYTRNPIKFPADEQNKKKAEILRKQLSKQTPVVIQLVNPVVRLYAMISNGELISGVSIKADSFEICSDNSSDNLFSD